jgi:transcriptional regulator with XRE-family HTH domain
MHVTGMAGKDIAARLEVTPQTISEWLHEPAAVAARESTRLKALAEAESVALEMVGVLLRIARGEDEDATATDRRQAAVAILERSGVVARQGIDHSGSLVTASADLSLLSDADLAEYGRLARRACGDPDPDDGAPPAA